MSSHQAHESTANRLLSPVLQVERGCCQQEFVSLKRCFYTEVSSIKQKAWAVLLLEMHWSDYRQTVLSVLTLQFRSQRKG